jgi:ABC-type branched-subunit amino acid transport system substrate-binding protein
MTLAALSRYAQTNFALVVPTVTTDAITARNYHNVYRLPTKDSTAGSLFARTFLHRGNNAIAVALDGSDYGYDAARGFVQQAHVERAYADTIFFPKVILDPIAAAKAIQARSPDYVYFAGKSADLATTASALRANGYTGDMGLSDGFYNADVVSQYGTLLAGSVVASSMPPLSRVPSITTLLSDFRNEVGSITAFSAYGYAAAQLIISASQRNNSTSRYTLLTTLQQGGTFTTLVGQFAFNLYGDPLVPNIYLYTLNKDGFTFLKPAIATGFVL